MDVTLDVIVEEIVAIDVIQESAIELTVVTGIPGSDGAGVVAGGTTGQILRKKSNTNFDTEWANPEAAAGVSSVNGSTGDVTLNQDNIADGTTHKQYSATEKTKLAGIATGATANDTDANLKNRANHTGTQAISTVTSLQAALDAKAPTASPTFTGTVSGITKSHVGLGNVDNTSDAGKPVSTATQTALDGKAASSHTHAQSDVTGLTSALTGKADTVHTHTASQVTDFAAAVDARIQNIVGAAPAALDTLVELAASLGNDANFAGTVTTALAGKQAIDQDLTDISALTPTNNDIMQRKAGAWTNRTPAQVKTDLTLVKGDVGLGNVDNTADTAKPVSSAQQTALDGKQPLDSDLTDIAALAPANDSILQRKSSAWVGRTMAQLKTDLVLVKGDVGLGNVDNTADSAKPVSTAQQTALDARFVWADGTTVSNARPSTSSKVIWVGGTTQPTNMATGDLWVKA